MYTYTHISAYILVEYWGIPDFYVLGNMKVVVYSFVAAIILFHFYFKNFIDAYSCHD